MILHSNKAQRESAPNGDSYAMTFRLQSLQQPGTKNANDTAQVELCLPSRGTSDITNITDLNFLSRIVEIS